jgi:toxin YoeB
MKKIEKLIESIGNDPFKGFGKPELLKYNWGGFWSRRITKEHRLIYNVEDSIITIYSLRGHYTQ